MIRCVYAFTCKHKKVNGVNRVNDHLFTLKNRMAKRSVYICKWCKQFLYKTKKI